MSIALFNQDPFKSRSHLKCDPAKRLQNALTERREKVVKNFKGYKSNRLKTEELNSKMSLLDIFSSD